MPDAFEREGLTPEDAYLATIALPAENPLLLIRQAFEKVVADYDGGNLDPVHPRKALHLVGENWIGGTVLTFGNGQRIRINVYGWDRDETRGSTSWPDPVGKGSWVLATAQKGHEIEGSAFVSLMSSIAVRLGGFISYGLERSQKAGGNIRSGWSAPDGDSPLEGVDVGKHRLLRTLGFEAAPVIEQILQSDEARAVMSEVLDVLPRSEASAGSGPKA